jgi:hypothetical protein
MVQFSQHSLQRAAQRNISPDEVEYIMTYGQIFHRAGAVIYFLRKRDIPEEDQVYASRVRLVGTALIFSQDNNSLITIWRNRKSGLKRIKQKGEFSLFTRLRQA